MTKNETIMSHIRIFVEILLSTKKNANVKVNMNITPSKFDAYVTPSAADDSMLRFSAEGEIDRSMLSKTTHFIRVYHEILSVSDSLAFFNMATSDVTFGNTPCEIRVHEDVNNINRVSSSVSCGGAVSARGLFSSWSSRLRTLVHIVKSLDSAVIHIDFPQSMEYDEALECMKSLKSDILQSLKHKDILILAPRVLLSPYTSLCGGVIIHNDNKFKLMAEAMSEFCTLYDTTLAEAFTHCVGYCKTCSVQSQHFFLQLPESVRPLRFNTDSDASLVFAISSGTIDDATLNFGFSNGGFLFDARRGKWSLSFLAQITETLPTTEIKSHTAFSFGDRLRLCIELLTQETHASIGAAFFQLVSLVRSPNKAFEELVNVAVQSIEHRYSIWFKTVSDFPPPAGRGILCRQASMFQHVSFDKHRHDVFLVKTKIWLVCASLVCVRIVNSPCLMPCKLITWTKTD